MNDVKNEIKHTGTGSEQYQVKQIFKRLCTTIGVPCKLIFYMAVLIVMIIGWSICVFLVLPYWIIRGRNIWKDYNDLLWDYKITRLIMQNNIFIIF